MTMPLPLEVHGKIPQWTLPDRLRKSREDAGLSQSQLAEALDISRNTVGNYEAGRVEPRRLVVRMWAMLTGVDYDWIMTGNARQQPTG